MKICIYGAGAVGSFLAARLAQAGKSVSVIARGPHLAAIRQDGLTLQSNTGRTAVRLPASDTPAELGPQDLVIVSVKTPSLPQIARDIAPLLHDGTAVAFAVNGVYWFYGDGFAPNGMAPDVGRLDRDGSLHRLIGVERSLGMVARSSNEVIAPGVVRNESDNNDFTIGEALPGRGQDRAQDHTRDRAPALAAALSGAGFTCRPLADIRRDMWAKLVHNATNSPLCSLTGVDLATAYSDPEIGRLAMALMRETVAVATAHGFHGVLEDPAQALEANRRLHHKPSMLQDLERGRAMEIDSQLAVLRDLARQAKVATPVLDTVLPILMMRARGAGCY